MDLSWRWQPQPVLAASEMPQNVAVEARCDLLEFHDASRFDTPPFTRNVFACYPARVLK